MALVVDASVGLKWALNEPDSDMAKNLALSDVVLLLPDFWLNEACNVLRVQVRNGILTPDEAREGLGLLREQIEPTPTADLTLHDTALDIALAINHSTYDTMYVAFAIATGADRVVVADGPFVRAMKTPPDPTISNILLPLAEWTATRKR